MYVIAKFDFYLASSILALVTIGLIMVTSASVALESGPVSYALRHAVYVTSALCLFIFVLNIELSVWERIHRLCLVGAIVLSVMVLIPGIGIEVNGSRRWINLGFMTLQASEWIKFLVLIYLAGYLARTQASLRHEPRALLRPTLSIAALLTFVLFEPDFGTTVVLALTTVGLFFVAGVRILHFLAIGVLGACALVLLILLQPYRLARIASYLDPWSVAFSSGYQLTQALIAFGRGEVFGVGLGEGIQKLSYLPEPHNDFILAVIAEETGFFGVAVIVMLFTVIVLRFLGIGAKAVKADRIFAGLLAYGAGFLIGIQAFINMGVSSGMLPTKGITLPFVSFGGNSLWVTAAITALVFRVKYESSGSLREIRRRGQV
ncbi:MAG: putative lipid II flippase FtsW [Gammaproteobacteria bacterium]|nr:putative lipid II flippase FtsW [Gammaproteobacteria bacterium]